MLEEAKKSDFDERMRTILELMISASCEAFEILPIIAYADIIRNVLYSGIWAKYELARKREQVKKMEDPYKILGVSRDASEDEIKKHTDD